MVTNNPDPIPIVLLVLGKSWVEGFLLLLGAAPNRLLHYRY